MVALLCASLSSFADGVYKTLTFPCADQPEIAGYTNDWKGTCDGIVWSIKNFNNNKNAWNFIKCGRKNNASVATITSSEIDAAISKVVVTMDVATKAYINTTYLEVAPDTFFTTGCQKTEVSISGKGVIEYVVNNPETNRFYRLTFDCAPAKDNGVIQISKVEFYNGEGGKKEEGDYTHASLDELLKEEPAGQKVVVPIKDEEISGFYIVTKGDTEYKNGVYLTRQANGKNFELFCYNVPEAWKVGDKLSGVAKGSFKEYQGTWEIALENWNDLSAAGVTVVATPEIAYDPETKQVTITEPSGNNTIYYTLDGSAPDDSKTVYEGPFTIESTTTVKAICYNDDDESSEVVSKTCSVTLSLNSIAQLIDNCTATSSNDAPEVTFVFSDLIVTGVNGSSVYVKDDKYSFCLFASGSKLERGDKISGSVTGKLYSYNNLPELSISDKWENITKSEGKAEVMPTSKTISEISAADASMFVRFTNLTLKDTITVSKKLNYILTDGTDTIVLRDNFNNLDKIVWSQSNKYSYNLNVFVIPFKDAIQYYAVSEADITMNTLLEPAVLRFDDFEDNQLFVYSEGGFVTYSHSVASDAPIVCSSSNEDVATLDVGTIHFKGCGVAQLTMSVDETDVYTAAKDSRTVRIWSGAEKTLADPISVEDAQALYVDGDSIEVWIKAYIVGYANGSMSKANFRADSAVATNVLIASKAGETDVTKCIPVELANKAINGLNVRDEIPLSAKPENFGKQIWIKGSIVKYFSQCGIKVISDWSWDGEVTTAIESAKVAKKNVDAIYNLAGQKVKNAQRGLYIINGQKHFVK